MKACLSSVHKNQPPLSFLIVVMNVIYAIPAVVAVRFLLTYGDLGVIASLESGALLTNSLFWRSCVSLVLGHAAVSAAVRLLRITLSQFVGISTVLSLTLTYYEGIKSGQLLLEVKPLLCLIGMGLCAVGFQFTVRRVP